jgi:predicted small lipoprotein YifL
MPCTLSLLFCFKEGSPMKKFVALSLVAVAALSLAACSKKGDENTAAADTNAAVDMNATTADTMADLNAAVENTTNAADAALENASNASTGAASNATNAM